jgi:hypothetical protein
VGSGVDEAGCVEEPGVVCGDEPGDGWVDTLVAEEPATVLVDCCVVELVEDCVDCCVVELLGDCEVEPLAD